MKRTVIFFRGRNTKSIIQDAERLGVVTQKDKIIVVCRKNDDLAEPGDEIGVHHIDGNVVVVCNGGTTQQQVPVIAWAVLRTRSPGSCQGIEYPGESSTLIEVGKDSINVLWGGDEE